MSTMNTLSQGTNARNVELKARLENVNCTIKFLQSKTGKEGTVILQKDIYYKVSQGKLKMRKFENPTNDIAAELIFYQRPNDARPKLSTYKKIDLNQQMYEQLNEVLTAALGVEFVVVKKRILFIIRNTRVHIDDVNELGSFIELETVLQADQTEEDGHREIREIMAELGIKEESVLAEGYLEMLRDQ